jgi:hypothetical protein
VGGDQGHPWTASTGQGHPWPAGRFGPGLPVDGGRMTGSPPDGGRKSGLHIDPPPPFPIFGPPQQQDSTTYSSHIAQTMFWGSEDHTLKTVESLVERCSGGGRRWVALEAIANPIQNRSRRRPDS